MASLAAIQLIIGFLTIGASADRPAVYLCTEAECQNCPSAVLSTGPNYPECVIYERDVVIGGDIDQFPPPVNGGTEVFFDIEVPEDPTCRYVIRTPANQDDNRCGGPVFAPKRDDICYGVTIKDTFMIQECCGPTECGGAGATRIPNMARSSSGAGSVVLRDADGNLLVPHSVGGQTGVDAFLESHGHDPSTMVKERSASGMMVYKKRDIPKAPVEKRACTEFIPDEPRNAYTITGNTSYVLSGYICDVEGSYTRTNSQTVGWSTTLQAGINTEIFSASVSFTFEESATQSSGYTFSVTPSDCGHYSWTPFFVCEMGTIKGCDGGDEHGEVCSAKRISDMEIDGQYTWVQTG